MYCSWRCSPAKDPEELVQPSLHGHFLCKGREITTVFTVPFVIELKARSWGLDSPGVVCFFSLFIHLTPGSQWNSFHKLLTSTLTYSWVLKNLNGYVQQNLETKALIAERPDPSVPVMTSPSVTMVAYYQTTNSFRFVFCFLFFYSTHFIGSKWG